MELIEVSQEGFLSALITCVVESRQGVKDAIVDQVNAVAKAQDWSVVMLQNVVSIIEAA